MSNVLTDKEVVLAIIGAIVLGMQLYSSYKQRQLEVRSRKMEERVEENAVLLKENTDATRQIMKQTDGITSKLLSAVKQTSYAAGKLKGAEDEVTKRDALDALEAEFTRKDEKKEG